MNLKIGNLIGYWKNQAGKLKLLKIGFRPILRKYTPRYYAVYAEKEVITIC